MKYVILFAVLAAGCSQAPEPAGPGQHATAGENEVRVLGEIYGYNNDDPRITVSASGRTVNVSVTSYGGGCHRKGDTVVTVSGLTAEVVPYDYTAPPGTPCTQPLRSFQHTAAIQFDQSGTATIRIRGIDRTARTGLNPAGAEIVFERQVEVR